MGGRSDEHSEGGASNQRLSNTKGLEQTKRGPPPGKEENALVLVGVGVVFANLVVEALGVRILAPLGHLPIFLCENLLHLGPVKRVALCQPTKIAKGEGGDDPVLGEADDDVGIVVGMLGQVRELLVVKVSFQGYLLKVFRTVVHEGKNLLHEGQGLI